VRLFSKRRWLKRDATAVICLMFAFVNLSNDQANATSAGNGFDINPGKRNLFGIRADHKYDVWNIAALDSSQRRQCLWNKDVIGSALLADGNPGSTESRAG
jgi:hypothetical protein